MLILVTYDVSTEEYEGQRRLRHVAQTCLNYGQRVQYSVFECEVNKNQYYQLKKQLEAIMNMKEDSIRFYRIHEPTDDYIEHMGIKEPEDFDEPMII